MCFSNNNIGANIDLTALQETDAIKVLFAENVGVVIQSMNDEIESILGFINEVNIIHRDNLVVL